MAVLSEVLAIGIAQHQADSEPGEDEATIAGRSLAIYGTHDGEAQEDVPGEDLATEEVLVLAYQEIIRWLGDGDLTARQFLDGVLADEGPLDC